MEDGPGPKKIRKIWPLPDKPPHEEMTVAAVIKPDHIKPGWLMMVTCSSAVKLELTPMGPIVKRIDSDPTFGGVLSVREYCYPFIAALICTGKWRGTRVALDVRRHSLVRVTPRFLRSLMEPQQVIEMDDAKIGKKKKKRKKITQGELMEQIFGKPGMAIQPMMPEPPEDVDPQAWQDHLENSGWHTTMTPDDLQGDPPDFPDDLPPPEDFGDPDDEEGQGQGAVL
jgi:hypothetical protein